MKRKRVMLLMILCGLWLPPRVWGEGENSHQFALPQQSKIYHRLTTQLRCPRCQQQTIAESTAPIAVDMRRKVAQLLQQGYSPQQVIDYMVARYGAAVSYDPPLTWLTLVVWLTPWITIVVGLLGLLRTHRVVQRRYRQQRGWGSRPCSTRPQHRAPLPLSWGRGHSAVKQRYFWLIVMLWILLVSAGGVWQTGAWQSWRAQRQALAALPALRQKVWQEPQPSLTLAEIEQLNVALGYAVLQDPHQLTDWLLLGRIAMGRGEVTRGIDAYQRAYQLAPHQPAIVQEYAEALMSSADRHHQQRAQSLLLTLWSQGKNNSRLLLLLASNALAQGEIGQAITFWQQGLTQIAAEDPIRESLLSHLQQLQQQLK